MKINLFPNTLPYDQLDAGAIWVSDGYYQEESWVMVTSVLQSNKDRQCVFNGR